jgi:hypothetical protein
MQIPQCINLFRNSLRLLGIKISYPAHRKAQLDFHVHIYTNQW